MAYELKDCRTGKAENDRKTMVEIIEKDEILTLPRKIVNIIVRLWRSIIKYILGAMHVKF